MELLKIIKEFIIKLWNWLINLFFKNKETNLSTKKKKNKHITNKTLHKAYINHDEENDNIINLYTGVLPKELEIINNKLDTIRKKVIKNNDEDIKKELNTLNNIGDLITEQKIFINNFDEIKSIIDNTLFDEDLHLNTQEKISLLKENIEELIDENLNTYEKNIIKKAYYEYEKVNYVIITTMIIDDIYNDLQKLNDKSLKNQHNKEYFIRKIKEIEEKIEHIKTLNTKEEVVRELENLKNDVYTKRKDKYDLLYNSEILKKYEVFVKILRVYFLSQSIVCTIRM